MYDNLWIIDTFYCLYLCSVLTSNLIGEVINKLLLILRYTFPDTTNNMLNGSILNFVDNLLSMIGIEACMLEVQYWGMDCIDKLQRAVIDKNNIKKEIF